MGNSDVNVRVQSDEFSSECTLWEATSLDGLCLICQLEYMVQSSPFSY